MWIGCIVFVCWFGYVGVSYVFREGDFVVEKVFGVFVDDDGYDGFCNGVCDVWVVQLICVMVCEVM